jgi:hypothetical protein
MERVLVIIFIVVFIAIGLLVAATMLSKPVAPCPAPDPCPEPLLSAPLNVMITKEGGSSLLLRWTEVEGADSYAIYLNGVLSDTTTLTSYVAEPDTTYNVAAIASSVKGYLSLPVYAVSYVRTTSISNTTPSILVVPYANGSLKLTWGNQAAASMGWIVYYAEGTSVTTSDTALYITGTSVIISGLTPSAKYTFAISAITGNGDIFAISPGITATVQANDPPCGYDGLWVPEDLYLNNSTTADFYMVFPELTSTTITTIDLYIKGNATEATSSSNDYAVSHDVSAAQDYFPSLTKVSRYASQFVVTASCGTYSLYYLFNNQ